MGGFLTVELPSGMIISDCKLMIGPAGRPWVALPAIRQLDRDGEPRRDTNGKVLWLPIIDFNDRDCRERFQNAVLDALRREHPEAFDRG
jgi:hypothetical protein